MEKFLLLDIEGTISPIDFVHKKLFPLAYERMESFVKENFHLLQDEVLRLAQEAEDDKDYPMEFISTDPASVTAFLRHQINHDRKTTVLKDIQGRIWQAAYEKGEVKSEIFADVRPFLEDWTGKGNLVSIFSSGSIKAQKVFLRHTDSGNLSPFITDYFDTTYGGKKEPASYKKILSVMKRDKGIFVSDIVEELEAAKQGGFSPILCIRKGNTIQKENSFPSISQLDEIWNLKENSE
jgi:enolase-phosphatase E1